MEACDKNDDTLELVYLRNLHVSSFSVVEFKPLSHGAMTLFELFVVQVSEVSHREDDEHDWADHDDNHGDNREEIGEVHRW